MKKTSIIAVALAATLTVGCKHKGDTPLEAAPVRVSVIAIEGDNYSQPNTFSGTVASANTATVSFAVAGTIEQLTVKEGQRVARGQLIGRLKSGDYTNARNIAQAQLAEAQDAYERLKKLHDANALPEIKWVEMEQKLKQAQNAADIAERTLDETVLTAPISGVVSRKLADVGQNVAPIEPVYEIVSTDALTIDFSVPENEVASFTLGQKASVAFPGLQPVGGRITQKAIVADPLTRSYTIKVEIPSEGGRILPGMIGTVGFEATAGNGDAAQAVIVLPSQAVNLSDDNRTFVWVVRNGVAARQFVQIDEFASQGIIVKNGLSKGDTVIVAGMQKVGTGSPVEIVSAE